MKELSDLLKTEQGKLLKKFLIAKYADFNKIENVKDYSKAQDQALELKAHKKASAFIKGILTEIIELESFNESVLKEEDKLYNI